MRIGITGHRHLRDPSAWEWVEASMNSQLDAVGPPWVAITSLAIGADQLLARLVLERGGSVRAILPFADIERSFLADELPAFRSLRDRSSVECLSGSDSDEDAYLAAGLRVADESEVLWAVWDGQPAKGKGGTGDVVKYALGRKIPVVNFHPYQRVKQST